MSAAPVYSLDDEAAQIAKALHAERSGNGWMACCPAHEDHTPSLSIARNAAGKTLLHCFAGCSQQDVIAALKEQGLWESRPALNGSAPGKTYYVYRDEQGRELHRTVRTSDKKFWQEHSENGQWIRTLGPRTVLYHLDELIARSSETVYIAEGEKDVDRLRSLGYLSTCNPMGAGKWLESYSETIATRESREAVVFYDNDAPGRDHAQKVAASLLNARGRVRIVDLPEAKDVSDYLALGFWKPDLDELIANAPYLNKKGVKEWRDGFKPKANAPVETTELSTPKSQQNIPWINITNRQLRDKRDECLSALQQANFPPALFVRTGKMVRIAEDEEGRQGISPVDDDVLRNHLTQAANFRRPDPRKVGEWIQTSPPADAVSSILALPPMLWRVPTLKAVIEAPALRRDGTILDTSGYDPATHLYYEPSPGLAVHVPDAPTAEDLRAAVAWIDDLIGEFPFTDQASRANKIAGMLTPVCRPAIDGSTPLQLLDATAPGSGKTLLSEVDSIITTGRPGSLFSAPKEKAEWDKQLTTVLWRGSAVVVMDNVSGRLESEDLCRALTSQVYAARIMKTQEQIDLPVYCSWVATGNNIQVDPDMARRCYRVRLDARCSNPAQRSGFKHPELKTWALENRSQILGALLTLARAWFVAGKPAPNLRPVGSFESWSFIIGGILQHAKIEGFLENNEEFLAQANPDAQQWENFLLTLHEVFYESPFYVGDVEKKLLEKTYNADTHTTEPTRSAALLRDSLPDSIAEVIDRPGFLKQRLSKAFAQRRGTWYGEAGTYLADAGSVKKTQRWEIRTGKKVEHFSETE